MIKPVLTYPNPYLRTKCKEVGDMTLEVKQSIQDLLDTIATQPALGLAHPQIGGNLRIFVLETSLNIGPKRFQVYINPEITDKTDLVTSAEGCLSFPNKKFRIRRPAKIGIAYVTETGGYVEESLEGILAIAYQHELDHLNGKLAIDF